MKWTARCVGDTKKKDERGCERLRPVALVRDYEAYPAKEMDHSPDAAVLVRGTLACGHPCSFISTWRQLHPHIQPIGVAR